MVGQTLNLNGKSYTIVGVADTSFCGLRPEFWFPAATVDDFTTSGRRDRGIRLVGRLKPNVMLAQAQAQLKTIATRLAEAYPESRPRSWLIWSIECPQIAFGKVISSRLGTEKPAAIQRFVMKKTPGL